MDTQQYNIDLEVMGQTFKMGGTIQELKDELNDLGAEDLSIFDSRLDNDKKIVQFRIGNKNINGQAVKK